MDNYKRGPKAADRLERFIIANANFDGTPKDTPLQATPSRMPGVDEQAGPGKEHAQPGTDATQVVRINSTTARNVPAGTYQRPPQRRAAPPARPNQAPVRPNPAPVRPNPAPAPSAAYARRSAAKRRRQQILIISVTVLTVVLLLGLLAAAFFLTQPREDDGLILPNVFAAGVNLSGMTPEEAKTALENATSDTYTRLDMTVEVLDTIITLTPQATGAKLDIDKVVQAAYSYGRTGTAAEQQRIRNQAAGTTHVVSVIPYLNLDTKYIGSVIDTLGNKYSSILEQPSVRFEGSKPTFSEEEPDLDQVFETMYIYLGTPEYGLNTSALYEQILEAYNTNIWQVVGSCTVTAPEALDLDSIYKAHCVEPEDAKLNESTYEITPESYGYGFDLEAVRAQLAEAEYGTTLEVPLKLIAPDILAADYDKLFRDTLASVEIPYDKDETNLVINLRKALSAINGMIIKAGDEFSFNDTVGQPTVGKGFKYVEMYVGTELKEVLGGGMSQVSSALYYGLLLADLDVLEREAHGYAQDYIQPGADAYTAWNGPDLRFANTSNEPIRIEAKLEDGMIKLAIIGTKELASEEEEEPSDPTEPTDPMDPTVPEEEAPTYIVKIEFDEEKVYKPVTLIQLMYPNNKDKYEDGDVLIEAITGYDISTYRRYYDAETGDVVEEILLAQSHYAKRNELVVEIYDAPEEPTEPSDPTDASKPTDSKEPTGTTKPGSSKEPTDKNKN